MTRSYGVERRRIIIMQSLGTKRVGFHILALRFAAERLGFASKFSYLRHDHVDLMTNR